MGEWLLDEAARRFGDRPALITGEATLPYTELAGRVDETARRLAARGLTPGALAALWDTNGVGWVVAAHAVWRCGAAVLPISTRWTDAEARSALERLRPACVLGGEAFTARAAGWGPPAWSHGDLAAGHGADDLPATPDPAAPMAVMLTSGTSGTPKAAVLSGRALLAGAEAVGQAIALTPADRWWLAMPFFHVGGLAALIRCARFGAAAVVAGRFEADRALAGWETDGVTIASVVPTMWQALLASRGDRPWPAPLRLAMLGGAAAPPDLVDASPLALPSYGLTEAGSTVTLCRPGAGAAERRTAGAPLPGVRLAILGPGGQPVPPGEEGEIAVAGPTLMDGYLGDPEATARVLRGGWLLTGDAGVLDEAGRLTVLGRRTDLIVTGGENVYPAEVESALTGHPGVAAAAVVGVPSRRWGASPFAFVVAAPGVDESALAGWLEPRLARFKHPRGYGFVAALPLLANGKVDRQALIAEATKHGYELA
ncbi:MAG: class I adenylate-forming enzyme family protein [Candidatus Sericytochromatia bacterium]